MMTRFLIAAVCLLFTVSLSAQEGNHYATIEGLEPFDVWAVIGVEAKAGWGFERIDFDKGTATTGWQKYTDFGLVSKRLRYTFEYEGGTLKMGYTDHEMEDKTRGKWEPVRKLSKKDRKTFDAVVEGIRTAAADQSRLAYARSAFFTNTQHLCVLFDDQNLVEWSAKAKGESGKFIWAQFISAEPNPDDAFDAEWKVRWRIIPQNNDYKEYYAEAPLYLTHYANAFPKRDKEGGRYARFDKLKKGEVYPYLAATIVEFSKSDSGERQIVVTD